MEDSFDVVVVGAGNAGQAVATDARAQGKSVAIIESRDVGGTCPLRGCVPKKVLVAACELFDAIGRASTRGIEVGPARIDWPKLVARERTFVEGASAGFESHLRSKGIEVIHGKARFGSPHAIVVDGRTLRASKIVIATGSAPKPFDFEGADLLVTSDDLLEMRELPRSMVFLGGGVIAFELGHVFARAGARVTIVHRHARPLPKLDEACVDRLVAHSRSIGIEIVTEVEPVRVVRRGQELVVDHRRGDVEGEIAADCVVNSSGRVAQVDGLDLAVGDVAHRDLRIDIDPFLRSKTNPDVLVAGDALDGVPQLSALATHMGHLAAHNLFAREPRALDVSAVPSVVFTVPNLASVGLTAERAKLAGRDVVVHDNDMHSWRSARSYAEDVAFARVVVDAKTEKIVGAHLLGHGAAETIHTFAAAIARGADARELAETVYAYPTFHSDIPYLVGRG